MHVTGGFPFNKQSLRLILRLADHQRHTSGPDPYHWLRTISAAEIQWQRVRRPPSPPPPLRRKQKSNASSSALPGEEEQHANGEEAGASSLLEEEEEEEEEEKDKEHMVFLLSKPRDYFSQELDFLVAAVAPCFPSVLFIRGLSTDHHGLVGQMSLRSLPQLFLFEESLLKVRWPGLPCLVLIL